MTDELKNDIEMELRGRLTVLEQDRDDLRQAIAALALAVVFLAFAGLVLTHHVRSQA